MGIIIWNQIEGMPLWWREESGLRMEVKKMAAGARFRWFIECREWMVSSRIGYETPSETRKVADEWMKNHFVAG